VLGTLKLVPDGRGAYTLSRAFRGGKGATPDKVFDRVSVFTACKSKIDPPRGGGSGFPKR